MSVALTGLDGSNPLAFLASLGVLVRGEPAWTMRWEQRARWTPIVEGPSSMDTLVDHLWSDVARWADAPALALSYTVKGKARRDLKPSPDELQLWWASLPSDAFGRGLAGSFGVPEVTDNNGAVKPNALHFTAGQQQFLKMVEELRVGLGRDAFTEALAGPWHAASTLPSFGWDARERRDYALRAVDPSTDKRTGTPGADWLGLMGWPLLPVFSVSGRLQTTGYAGRWKSGTFSWPLWDHPCGSNEIRALLAHRLPRRTDARAALGIPIVYSCGVHRTDQGGYGSFTPARPA